MLNLPDPALRALGVDEAGRGALAGPVVASAIFIEHSFDFLDLIDDSKKINHKNRKLVYDKILNSEEFYISVGQASPEEIDTVNILQATFDAMHRAIDAISVPFNQIMVDGPHFRPYRQVHFDTIIKGDAKYVNIAAASIVAKVYRDEIMDSLHEEYPMYGWNTNKGYGTLAHRRAILEHGYSPYHRRSFVLKSSPPPSSEGN